MTKLLRLHYRGLAEGTTEEIIRVAFPKRYIRCFCATTSHDIFVIDLWPFELESVSCTALLMSDPNTNFYYPTTIGYWVTILNIWSHFRYLKQSLRMRRVTWPLTEGKNYPHFWNPWPQFTYSLCHFQGATTKIKPCYRQKIVFSHYEGYKVYCACAVTVSDNGNVIRYSVS